MKSLPVWSILIDFEYENGCTFYEELLILNMILVLDYFLN